MKKIYRVLYLIVLVVLLFSSCGSPKHKSQTDSSNLSTTQISQSNIGNEQLQYLRENSDESGNSDYDYKVYETYVEITWYRGLSTDVVIPEKIDGLPVKVIGPYAFQFYNHERDTYIVGRTEQQEDKEKYFHITSVILPKGLIEIGKSAFYQQALKEIVIPDSVITIEDTAFSGNRLLKNIVFGNSVQTIGDGAFGDCGLQGNIILPESLLTIGECAFDNTFYDFHVCYNGQDYYSADKIRNQSGIAYYDEPNATITIPSSVSKIGKSAFGNREEAVYTLKCKKGSAAVQYIDEENYPKYTIE